MRRMTVVAALAAFCLMTVVAWASIPVPDVVTYGIVSINGKPVSAADDVTIIATVDVSEPGEPPEEQEIGRYHVGDNPNVGDLHVLRLRLESLADGSGRGDNAALVGDTAVIYIQEAQNPPQQVATFVIQAAGVVENVNFPPILRGDFDFDGDVDLDDLQAFVPVLLGEDTDPVHIIVGDMDGNAKTNATDITPFVDALLAG